jgi:plasmid maintenance system antidote protein VapI
MMEAAFAFDHNGNVIHWHLPPGRTGGSLPDSRDLWSVMWANRKNLGGVAHTHPWSGRSGPSGTDVTTFSACEKALGKRLLWPIITFTDVAVLAWDGPGKHDYAEVPKGFGNSLLRADDVEELRRLSISPENLSRNEFEPNWASPPGETILEAAEENDLHPDALAVYLNLSLDEMKDLLSGRMAITDEMADNLSGILGGDKQFWLNRDSQYQESLLRLGRNRGE